MRIAVLGPLEVRSDDGAPVEIAGAKERLLLAVLAAAAGRVVSSDRIVESLWDGDSPPSARKSLQAHVVHLRTALEPGRPKGSSGRYVVRRGTGYALAVGRSDVDALLMVDRAARGHAQLAAGESVTAERDLASALALWHGDPYADWPDAEFAEPERRRLLEVRAGAVAGLMEARLHLGRPAEVLPELERWVAEEPLREDWWRLLVLALYRAGRQADALAATRRVRAVLADELGAEPGPALRELEAAILAQDPSLNPPTARVASPGSAEADVPDPTSLGACPYKGLATYQVADAPLFHGRRHLISALVARLVDAPLVVVSGPSGAGKSSVVRAGLVPALGEGALLGSRSWLPMLLTPGRRPVDTLAPLTGEQMPTAPVLLVVDQFEEIWGPDVDPAERTAFLDAILGLLDDEVVVRCVLVVRGDHIGRLAEHAPIAERVGGALVLVPGLSETELREIVREPAATVGLAVEPDLLDAVVGDGLGRPGALPLLSTALVGTWERRSGELLTLAGYLRSGGVAGALTRSAETAYGALEQDERETARRLLVRLADIDDGGSLVRRRVPLAELDLESEPRRRAVVEAFVRRRLLSLDAERLEVAHEALLSEWPRLAQWLQDDTAGRAVRRHLDPAATEWAAAGRPDDELYRGARLTAAMDWASAAYADLTPVERQFLEASRGRVDAELTAAHDRADREAAGRRRTRRLAVALAGLLVLALVATVLAVHAQRDAQESSVVAEAGRLANLAVTTDTTDVSLLLAVQAQRLADLPETRSALLGAVAEHGRALHVAALQEPMQRLTVGAGGMTFAGTAPADLPSTVVLGDTSTWSATGDLPKPLEGDDESWGAGAWADWDASPEQSLVVGVGGALEDDAWVGLRAADGTVRPLAARDEVGGVPVAVAVSRDGEAAVVLLAHGDPYGLTQEVRPLSWSLAEFAMTDGSRRTIAGTGSLPAVEVLEADVSDDTRSAVVATRGTTTAATLIALGDHDGVPLVIPARNATAVGFRALSSGAALMWSDGEVTVYGRDGRIRQSVDAGPGRVTDVVESPDGTWVATVGSRGGVVLWDVDAVTGLWTSRDEFVGHAGEILDADADPEGHRLVTLGADDRLAAWDATAGGGFGSPVPGFEDHSPVAPPQLLRPGLAVVLAVPPGAATTATEAIPLAVAFFHPSTGAVVDSVEMGTWVSGEPPPTMSVSPDGRMVAVTTGLDVAVLDTATSRTIVYDPPDPAGGALGPARVSCTAWAPGSSRLLVCVTDTWSSAFVSLDPHDGRELGRTPMGAYPDAVAISSDGRLLVIAALNDGAVLVLDAGTLELRRYVSLGFLLGYRPTAAHVSIAPDGRRIAITSQSGLLLIDTDTWQATRSPAPLVGKLVQAEWFPDSRTLAAAGGDGGVYLYDVEQGQVRTLPLPRTPDAEDAGVHLMPGISDELVVLGGQRPGRRYPLDPAAWSARACEVAGRDFTEDEWARYLPNRDHESTCGASG